MNEFMTMTNQEFAKNCKRVAQGVLSAWCHDCSCGTTDGKKQFYLIARHSWGVGYCDWDHKKRELLNALREAGAVNISGKVRWNFVRLYFDKRKRAIREDN